jgi:hypothetical protein
MDWATMIPTIISSVLAGGIVGQLVTAYLNNRASSTREFNKWLREERFKVFVEWMTLVSSSNPPNDNLQLWPATVRATSQKVLLLLRADGGNPPKKVSELLEQVFQHVYQRRNDPSLYNQNDKVRQEWTEKFRLDVDDLRKAFNDILLYDK